MAEERFLIVRLSSLGDIVLTAPAAAMLRHTFPLARIDWLVDSKWSVLFAGCTIFDHIIELERGSFRAVTATVKRLRAAHYTSVIDFQGLYKSAVLSFLSGAHHRVGLAKEYAREGRASFLYTERVTPPSGHIVDQNRALAAAAGATAEHFPSGFPRCTISPEEMARRVVSCGPREYFVVNPGGGWGSKCWPADRYGMLCRKLAARNSLRSVVNYGPGEQALAEEVARAAAPVEAVLFSGGIPELTGLLAGARFVVAGDTGPLHLAVAMGTPVIGLYGPTDPVRNGPYNRDDIVVCNERFEGMEHTREREPASSMRSITVEQVLAAVARRLEKLD